MENARSRAGALTELVHTHSLRSCSLQLEKVVIKPAQVLPASLRRKPDVEVGTVGSQNKAVLGRRRGLRGRVLTSQDPPEAGGGEVGVLRKAGSRSHAPAQLWEEARGRGGEGCGGMLLLRARFDFFLPLFHKDHRLSFRFWESVGTQQTQPAA